MKDIVDFDDVLVQHFNKVFVEGGKENGKLVLEFDDDKVKLDIQADKTKLIEDSLRLSKLLESEEISLLDLKEMEVIDFRKRDELKKEIDDIIERMYELR